MDLNEWSKLLLRKETNFSGSTSVTSSTTPTDVSTDDLHTEPDGDLKLDVDYRIGRNNGWQIVCNGYNFHRQRQTKNTIHWLCRKKNEKCHARIITRGEKIIAAELNHSHSPTLTHRDEDEKSFAKLEDLVDYIDKFEEKVAFGFIDLNEKKPKKIKKKTPIATGSSKSE